jgi:hypothetical protein
MSACAEEPTGAAVTKGAATTISLSVGIPHTPWRPERAASLERMRISPIDGEISVIRVFSDRVPHWVWSKKMWQWASEQPVSHCLFLADDTILAPNAIRILRAMLEAAPEVAIGLSSQHPLAMRLFRHGCRWYTCQSPWLVGWAYCLPRAFLVAFLGWRERQPLERLMEWGDDQLLNQWLAEYGVWTFHPLPTPFNHDLELESTLGHPIDSGGRREASSKCWARDVRPSRGGGWANPAGGWDDPDYWRQDPTTIPTLECPPLEVSWEAWEADQAAAKAETIPAPEEA